MRLYRPSDVAMVCGRRELLPAHGREWPSEERGTKGGGRGARRAERAARVMCARVHRAQSTGRARAQRSGAVQLTHRKKTPKGIAQCVCFYQVFTLSTLCVGSLCIIYSASALFFLSYTHNSFLLFGFYDARPGSFFFFFYELWK